MEDAEREQRSHGDRFWGYDNEIDNCSKERANMNAEEKRSRIQELHHTAMTNQSKWEREIKEEIYTESFVRALEQVQERRRYLKTVFSTERSKSVIDYKWSTRLKVRSLNDVDPANLNNSWCKRSKNTGKLRGSRGQTPITGQLSKHSISQQERPTLSVNLHNGQGISRICGADGSLPAPLFINTGPYGMSGSLTSVMRLHHKGTVDTFTQESTVRHTEAWDGHPEFKWDQEIMLKKCFGLLCQNSARAPGSTSSANVLFLPDYKHLGPLIASLPDVQRMLRYTVFGSWVKRKKWELFRSAFSKSGISELSITLVDWLALFKDLASKERAVERRLIRTDDEHRSSAVHACNRWYERRERLSNLARNVVVGSMIWSLHGRGVTWLPAIVEAINVRTPSNNKESGTDDFTYDLSYLITQEAFALAADLQTSAHQVTKLSAMTLLADRHKNVPHDRNQNQREDDGYDSQRVLNVTKSRCNNSHFPEKVLIEYVYDKYYSRGDTANSRLHIGEGEEEYTNASAHVQILFDAIEEIHMAHSSEALSCVSGRIGGLSLPPTHLQRHRGSQVRGILDGSLYKGFLLELQAPGGGGSSICTEKMSMPVVYLSIAPSIPRFLEREEWMETCIAAMDISRYNSY